MMKIFKKFSFRKYDDYNYNSDKLSNGNYYQGNNIKINNDFYY